MDREPKSIDLGAVTIDQFEIGRHQRVTLTHLHRVPAATCANIYCSVLYTMLTGQLARAIERVDSQHQETLRATERRLCFTLPGRKRGLVIVTLRIISQRSSAKGCLRSSDQR